MNPDGSDVHVYAYGIRNAGGGLAINPKTGGLWCSVNERDGWATIWFPTTSRMCRKAASTAGRITTSAEILIRGTRANIPS